MAEPCFVLPVRVYYEDTDAGGVVYYANYLKYLERARTEWLRTLGFEQRRLLEDHGVVFAVHRVELAFARPARLDDELQVTLAVARCSAVRMRFRQAVQPTGDAARLVDARVDVACLDAAHFRPRRMPRGIQEAIGQWMSI